MSDNVATQNDGMAPVREVPVVFKQSNERHVIQSRASTPAQFETELASIGFDSSSQAAIIKERGGTPYALHNSPNASMPQNFATLVVPQNSKFGG